MKLVDRRKKEAIQKLHEYAIESPNRYRRSLLVEPFYNLRLCRKAFESLVINMDLWRTCRFMVNNQHKVYLLKETFRQWRKEAFNQKDGMGVKVYELQESQRHHTVQTVFNILKHNYKTSNYNQGKAVDFRGEILDRKMRVLFNTWKRQHQENQAIALMHYMKTKPKRNIALMRIVFVSWSQIFIAQARQKRELQQRVVSARRSIIFGHALRRWRGPFLNMRKNLRKLLVQAEEFHSRSIMKRSFSELRRIWAEAKRRSKDENDAIVLFEEHMRRRVANELLARLQAYRNSQRKLEFYSILNRTPYQQAADSNPIAISCQVNEKNNFDATRAEPKISNVSTAPSFNDKRQKDSPHQTPSNTAVVRTMPSSSRRQPRPLPSSTAVKPTLHSPASPDRGHGTIQENLIDKNISSSPPQLAVASNKASTSSVRSPAVSSSSDSPPMNKVPPAPPPPSDPSYELNRINSRLQTIEETLESTAPILSMHPSLGIQRAFRELNEEAADLKIKRRLILMASNGQQNKVDAHNKNRILNDEQECLNNAAVSEDTSVFEFHQNLMPQQRHLMQTMSHPQSSQWESLMAVSSLPPVSRPPTSLSYLPAAAFHPQLQNSSYMGSNFAVAPLEPCQPVPWIPPGLVTPNMALNPYGMHSMNFNMMAPPMDNGSIDARSIAHQNYIQPLLSPIMNLSPPSSNIAIHHSNNNPQAILGQSRNLASSNNSLYNFEYPPWMLS